VPNLDVELSPVWDVIAAAPLLQWVMVSAAVYILAANLLWWTRSLGRRPATGSGWAGSPYGRNLFQVGSFLYYVIVPYLALGGWLPLAGGPRILGWQPQQGLLALADMGLVVPSQQWPVTRWLEAAGTGLGLGFLSLLALGLAWANALSLAPSVRPRLRFAPLPWWSVLVAGLSLEVHWAFYRGALAVVLDDVYAGTFVGLALVVLEWVLNPFWRHGVAPPAGTTPDAGRVWLNAGLVLTSTLVFLLTRNLWICLAVHWLLVLAFWALRRQRRAAGESPYGTKETA
jgi:hypothetical protein